MVWEPKSCCGCCKPKIGALILGYWGVIGAVLGLLSIIKGAFMSTAGIEEMCRGTEGMMAASTCYDTTVTGTIISAIEEIIRGGISLMLIFGVKKNNQCLMLPYMIFQVIGIVLVGLIVLAVAIFLAVFRLWLGSFIVVLIGAGIEFLITYCFLVVRVCYKEVKEENRMKGNEIEVGYIQHQEPPPPAYKM